MKPTHIPADGVSPTRLYEDDARRLLEALEERLGRFGLAIHEGKTRLIEFGRFAARRCEAAGLRRPETFDFLGFTHYCGKTRKGRFMVKRGHYGYYGVIFNSRSLHAFYEGVKRSWFKALRRRSQKSRMNWQRFNQLLAVYPLPKPVIHQPWYSVATGPQVTFQKSPVR